MWTDWASARSNDCSCPSSSTDFSSDRALVTNNILEMAVRDFAYWIYIPLRKKPKSEPTSDTKGMFPGSHLTNCTFNITIAK